MPSALSRTVPLATATVPPAATAAPLIAVIVRPGFSNVSLASGAKVTGASSLVLTESFVMSATALTAIETVPLVVAVPSLVTMPMAAVPLKSAVGT